nr:hypothetical protein [Pandoravirus massiliensis]
MIPVHWHSKKWGKSNDLNTLHALCISEYFDYALMSKRRKAPASHNNRRTKAPSDHAKKGRARPPGKRGAIRQETVPPRLLGPWRHDADRVRYFACPPHKSANVFSKKKDDGVKDGRRRKRPQKGSAHLFLLLFFWQATA